MQNYLTQVMEKLTPHGPVKSRAMFGGYGIYFREVIIGVIVEDKLYFRVDDETIPHYEKYHSEFFTYDGKTKKVIMPYMTLPELVLKNSKLLKSFIEQAYEASLRKKTMKKRTYSRGNGRLTSDRRLTNNI